MLEMKGVKGKGFILFVASNLQKESKECILMVKLNKLYDKYFDTVCHWCWTYDFFGWRINYWLASKSLVPRIKKAEIHAEQMGSDHCPVSVTLDL